MSTYAFTVVLANVDGFSSDALDRLFEAGCDDGTPGQFAGECVIEFDRASPSLEVAIRSAIDNVWAAGFDVKRVQLDVEHGPNDSPVLVRR
jgi:hypothetical protein